MSPADRGRRPSHSWVTADEPELRAAFADAERAVGDAFALALGRAPATFRIGTNPHEALSYWLEWWQTVPAPFDSLSCEVMLLRTDDGPEVTAKVAVWTYLGRGCDADDALWESGILTVLSAAEAAAAVRGVTAEMVRQLTRLDLRPYLAGTVERPRRDA